MLRRDVPPGRVGPGWRLIGAAIALIPALNLTYIAIDWRVNDCDCGNLTPSWSWLIAALLAVFFYGAAAAIAWTAVVASREPDRHP